MKYDLNTLVIKGYVLMPNTELKIDLKINIDIIESSKLFDNSKVLVVTDNDLLEETLDITRLPKIGTIAKIVKSFELPNGLVRLTLKGLSRADIINYSSIDGLEAVLKEKKDLRVSNEEVIIGKLNKELY